MQEDPMVQLIKSVAKDDTAEALHKRITDYNSKTYPTRLLKVVQSFVKL